MSLLDVSSENIHLQLNETFKVVAQKISMLLASEGLHRRAYLEGLPFFGRLSIDQKKDIVEQLSFYQDLCSEQIAEGFSLKDSPTFIWRALRSLGLTPPSDLFSTITQEDIIEIYSSENRQLFRNFNFFEYCSYSFEELHSLEWWHLFQRDGEVLRKLYEPVDLLMSGKVRESIVPNVEPHVISEISSEDRLSMQYDIRLVSPLFKNRQPAAYLVVERAQLIKN
jgi:hypothetical protein